MAKGNLILGTAKNSVGDVVMYRREGAQITRVRVRNVKNPKTNAQSFQRAIMAPIAKFYSPLSVVLERSFEGLSKAKSHNKFNQVNANLARANKWALPKGTGFFPLPYQLSQGTIPAVKYGVEQVSGALSVQGISRSDAPTTMGELSEDFVSIGYNNGDVVTIILVSGDKSNLNVGTIPVAAQFQIDTTSKAEISTVLSTISIITESGAYGFKTKNGEVIAGAIIVARFDGNMWRRSTQSLVVVTSIITDVTSKAKVAAAIASYGMTAGDGNPLVYLDGDELTDGQ